MFAFVEHFEYGTSREFTSDFFLFLFSILHSKITLNSCSHKHFFFKKRYKLIMIMNDFSIQHKLIQWVLYVKLWFHMLFHTFTILSFIHPPPWLSLLSYFQYEMFHSLVIVWRLLKKAKIQEDKRICTYIKNKKILR